MPLSLSRITTTFSLLKSHTFSTLHHSSSQKLYTLLLKNNSCNIERTLSASKLNLDYNCVTEVLHKCKDFPHLGIRFFIWAGLHPTYRHSGFMYSKAVEFFKIRENPSLVKSVVDDYRDERWLVSVKMFRVVLMLCKEAGLVDEALWVLREMKVGFNLGADTVGFNVVIRMVCEKGDMDTAEELVKEMGSSGLFPDVVTCVLMVKGFCNVGRLEDACRLLKGMKEEMGCVPNKVAYSAFLEGVCRFGSVEMALDLLDEMEKEGGDCVPNAVTYTTLIQSFCGKGMALRALEILDRMEAVGCVPNKVLVRTLIQGLCSEGHIDEAFKCINRVVEGGSVTYGDCYSSVVIQYIRLKKIEEAEKLFKHILTSGTKPDGLACNVLLKELSSQGRILDGVCLYDEIEKIGCVSFINSDVCSSLLVGLCQQKHFVQAEKLAKSMLERRVSLKASDSSCILIWLEECEDTELNVHLHGIARLAGGL